jgi:hypothetical protein
MSIQRVLFCFRHPDELAQETTDNLYIGLSKQLSINMHLCACVSFYKNLNLLHDSTQQS